ncbi:uncharacterized protein LOC143299942 [Babylonia areolata]|uniref:uncharacterized protein LOC143299942 n=1 Tax=Babylonia areolata TaxID=304850 RepID=UPI003FD0FFC9
MMKTAAVFLALLGIAVALRTRERRQAMGCLSAFKNVPNLCASNPKGQVFFQHPSDPSKFLQCDMNNRMYIVQCPAGEVFDVASSACQSTSSAQVTLPHPQTNKPVASTVLPPTIKQNTPALVGGQKLPTLPTQKTPGLLPGVQTTVNAPVVLPTSNNPCTPSNVALGKLYFSFPGDKTKFYECDLKGNAQVVSCPPSLQWSQNVMSCVYPLTQQTTGTPGGTASQQTPKPTPQLPSGHPSNPCTAKAVAAGRFFFPHPDPNKYIQCDMWGDAFTNSCPTKLVWNAYLQTCYSPLFSG